MVLPRYKNTSFLQVEIGEVFGIHDIFASMVVNDKPMLKWWENKARLKRMVTVQAKSECDLLTCTIKDFYTMEKEFPAYYQELVDISIRRMRVLTLIKIKSAKIAYE